MHRKQYRMRGYNCGWFESKHADILKSIYGDYLAWNQSETSINSKKMQYKWVDILKSTAVRQLHPVNIRWNQSLACSFIFTFPAVGRLAGNLGLFCNLWWWHGSWTRTSSCWFLTCVHLLYSSAHSQAFCLSRFRSLQQRWPSCPNQP